MLNRYPHTNFQINHFELIQDYAARFVANDHRRTTSPTTLVLTLNCQTLERRRIIKQAMTFYKIINNNIEIYPAPPPRSRLNTVVAPPPPILILPPSHPHLESNPKRDH